MTRLTHPTGEPRPRTRGASSEELRRHNLSAVLRRLHSVGPASRSELTALTRLNRSTIADLIGELSEIGLVEEGPGSAGTGPGRPSPVVSARSAGAVVLAVELDVDSIAVATIGLGGHVFNRQRTARPRRACNPESTVRDAARLARPLLDALPEDHRLVGVGVGVAGITRQADGFVHLAPNLGWRDVALGSILVEELGLPEMPLVANEADLGALGEFRRGVRPGVRHLVYVSGEVGIGAGVIVDGVLLHGRAGYAGEAGHMKVNPGGLECRCGGIGCWETEAGEAALLRHVGAANTGTGIGAVQSLVRRASTGDAATLRAIDEVGRWLGLGIANLINIFNPEIVVLGGLYEQLFSFVERSVDEAVRTSGLAAPTSMVTIVRSGLGADAPLIGAAESVLAAVLADPAGPHRSLRIVAAV